MHAISLYQPWASFIALGLKPYETRSRKPPTWLIGKRIAIHAAKKAVALGDREWARRVGAVDLPLGAIVCTAVLAWAYECTNPLPLNVRPDEYGDYSPGRWAWRLTDIERMDPPIPIKGAQGFWKWEP